MLGNRRTSLLYALALAAVGALPFLFSQGPPQAAPRAAMLSGSVASVRLELGVRDAKPRAWDGTVTARSGEVLTVRNWRPRPGDSVAGNAWKLASRAGVNFALRAWEAERLTDARAYLNTPGVVIDVAGSAASEIAVETANGSFTVRPFDLAPGAPVSFLDGAVIAQRVAPAERVSSGDTNADFPSIAALPDGRIVTAWSSFRDNKNELLARDFDGKQWGVARAIPTGHSDIQMVKLAAVRDRVAAVWSAQVDGNWDIYVSRLTGANWSAPERVSSDAQPDIYPAAATDSKGNLWVTWQGFRNGKSDVFARRWDGQAWSAEDRVSASPANDWTPAIAADRQGNVYVAWDTYDKGNYDVMMRRWDGSRWQDAIAVTSTPKFEANVSLACDAQNRVWAAWNEAGMDWGKDTGFIPRKQGTPLYRARWVGVAVYDGAKWMEPLQQVEESLPPAMRNYNDMPQLAAGPSGHVLLFFRHRNLRIRDVPSDTPAHRAAWELHMTTYEGDRWRRTSPVPFTQGRQDMRYAFAAANGALYAAWPMDNRDYEDFLFTRADVYAARIPVPAANAAASLQLRDRREPKLTLFPTHYEEAKDLARIHSYTLESGGKKYGIYRGDTHRHTEFSMDGNNDGSLLDAYRYAIDAAELDFMLTSEHNGAGGPDVSYVNWLLQQHVDIFSVAGKFAPFYGYERSVGYPNGHRNILFTKRNTPTLPIPQSENRGETGAKMLYEYLKKNNGIAISHTSASNMGTDWRDNDPAVEPLVEIYQGDRVSAEYEGAPKAAFAGNPASAPGGFRPMGYVWNAWAKGYKLGVQVASDHLSTHISYACTIAENFTREGLISAMKVRHSYGATDNIILDYRMRNAGKEYLQGDITEIKGNFDLSVKVIGTQPVRQIDIVRGQKFVHTSNPMKREVDFTFRDSEAWKGEQFYYVRVIQADEQIAWSSPIWIKRQ